MNANIIQCKWNLSNISNKLQNLRHQCTIKILQSPYIYFMQRSSFDCLEKQYKSLHMNLNHLIRSITLFVSLIFDRPPKQSTYKQIPICYYFFFSKKKFIRLLTKYINCKWRIGLSSNQYNKEDLQGGLSLHLSSYEPSTS